MLQCVAVYCSVLQWVAVGYRAAFEKKEVLTSSNIALLKVIELQQNGLGAPKSVLQ